MISALLLLLSSKLLDLGFDGLDTLLEGLPQPWNAASRFLAMVLGLGLAAVALSLGVPLL